MNVQSLTGFAGAAAAGAGCKNRGWGRRHSRPVVLEEAALAFIICINSMGVALITHSGLGISAISSVPYALTCIIPAISQGTWSVFFQVSVILALMAASRKLVPAWFLSLLVGTIFSLFLDVHEAWVSLLPDSPAAGILCYAAGYFSICLGVAVSNLCRMPIIPTDLFPREFTKITGLAYSRVKTTFDVSCLIATAVLTLVFLGGIRGLGIGTIISALTMGKVIHLFTDEIRAHVQFRSLLLKG